MKEALQAVEIAINVAKKHGIATQKEFAQKLEIYPPHLSNLKHDRPISPKLMGHILEVLKPDDDELDQIINPWASYLRKNGGFGHHIGTRSTLLISASMRQEPKTTLGAWLDKTASEADLSLNSLAKILNLSEGSVNHYRKYSPSIEHMVEVLIPKILSSLVLNDSQKNQFIEALAQTIEIAAEKNKLSQNTRNVGKKIQNSLQCKTYTGGQAAEKLHVSRQRIHQRKIKAGIKHKLLSESDLQTISGNYTKTLS